ncbi:MAG: hypothetical protein IKP58_19395 [Victivallales bacterium]|nr:hypothetical protein [Victivallales bacterium]
MMKRFITIAVLVATVTSVMAVTYNSRMGTQGNMVYYERTDIDKGWIYDNGTFEFTSAYVWTDLSTRLDPKASGSISLSKYNENDLVEFGYYKIGGDNSQAMVMYKLNEAGEVSIKNSVIFEDGDKIGIYAKINETQNLTTGHYVHTVNEGTRWNPNYVDYESDSKNYYYKDGQKVNNKNGGKWVADTTTVTKTYKTTTDAVADLEGASVVINNVDHDSRGQETQYFCLFTDKFGAVDHFEYYMAGLINSNGNYDDFIDDVIEQNGGNTNITDSDGNAVGGQPLPGLLLSMVIGGTAVAGIAKKRKKA